MNYIIIYSYIDTFNLDTLFSIRANSGHRIQIATEGINGLTKFIINSIVGILYFWYLYLDSKYWASASKKLA